MNRLCTSCSTNHSRVLPWSIFVRLVCPANFIPIIFLKKYFVKLYFISSVNKIRCNDLLGVSSSGSAVIILSICVLSLVDWNWNWVAYESRNFVESYNFFCWRSCRISCRSVLNFIITCLTKLPNSNWLLSLKVCCWCAVFSTTLFIHVSV